MAGFFVGLAAWRCDAAFCPVPCPRCGSRLISKSAETPSRLICANCAAVLPQPFTMPAWVWMQHNVLRLLMLLMLVVLPLLVQTLSPWAESPEPLSRRKVVRLTTGRNERAQGQRRGSAAARSSAHPSAALRRRQSE